MNYGAVLAAGSGSRMGSELPKQFLEIDGKPILVLSTEKFLNCKLIDKTVIAVPEAYLEYTKDMMERYFPGNDLKYLSGGADRSATLKKTVDFIIDNFPCDAESVIVTHDGVRPFITDSIIRDNIEAAGIYGACNTAVPAVDTIFLSEDGEFMKKVLDRSKLFHAQTPQSFNLRKLKQLLDSTSPELLSTLTDGCSVFTVNGLPVRIVHGSRENIKITYPSDIK